METQKEKTHKDDYTLVGKVLDVIPSTTLDFRRFVTGFKIRDGSEEGKGEIYHVNLDHYEDSLNKGDLAEFDINLRAYLTDFEDVKHYQARGYRKLE